MVPAMSDLELGPYFEEFVRDQVESGRFRDAGEVVRAGLRLLEDREADRLGDVAELRRSIAAAFDDSRPSLPIDDVFAELRAGGVRPADGA